MAVFETWLKSDLKKPVTVKQLPGFVFSQDSKANKVGVIVTDGGKPVTLSGTVYGYVIKPDGTTVEVAGAIDSEDASRASFVMPQEAYAVGHISIVIKLSSTGSVVTTLAACTAYVYQSRKGTGVVPTGTVIPDLQDLEEVIAEAEAATAAAETAAESVAAVIAADYSDLTFPVKAGTLCYHEDALYKANQAIATSEEWTAAHWTQTTIEAELSALKSALVTTQGVIGNCLEYWSDVNSGTSRNTTITRDRNIITYNGTVSNTLYTKLSGDIVASPTTLYNVATGEIPFINGHSYKMVIAKIGGTFTNGVQNDTTIAIRRSTAPQSTFGEQITITDAFVKAETDFVWNVDDVGYISGFTRKSVVYNNYKLMILIFDTTYDKNVNYLVEQALTTEQKEIARNNIGASSVDDRFYKRIADCSSVALSGNLRNFFIPFEFVMGEKYEIKIDFVEFHAASTAWKYATSICPDTTGDGGTDLVHIDTAPEAGSQYSRILIPSQNQHYLRVVIYTEVDTFNRIRVTIEAKSYEENYKRYEQLYEADDQKYQNYLTQIKGPSRSGKNALRTPISLLWFTDIHNDCDNTIQILRFADKYKGYIDDVVCTGDIVEKYENGMNWWDVIDGHEKVLLTIGNHEVFDNDYQYTHTQTEIYNRYISPYVANWNVQQPNGASDSGLNYWYKDYSDYYIRLVSIDCMFWDSDQLAWLTNVLSDARTNGLSVIIATHYPPAHITPFDTTFTSAMRDQADMYVESPEGAMEAVQSFIAGGGDFVCWMCGHTHTDFMGTAIDYPDQMIIVLACAMNSNQNYNDTYRNDYINMNTFNLMGVDTSGKVIKIVRVGAQYDAYLRKKDTICINYKTKRIL